MTDVQIRDEVNLFIQRAKPLSLSGTPLNVRGGEISP